MADPVLLLRVLILIGVANSAPVLATRILGGRLSRPLDGGIRFFDGRPLFGASKTIRGIVAALAATSLSAPLLGFDWTTGAAVAAAALTGDLVSSFTKRRLGLAVHAQAIALDQIPEVLLPLLLLRPALDLGFLDIVVVIAIFMLLEAVLSRILFRLGVRDRPY